MKKLILILFLLIPLTAFSLSFGCKDKPKEKFFLIDPDKGVDYVFSVKESRIKQVGVIDYFTFSIIHLKPSLKVKTTEIAGEKTDSPSQRRIELDAMIRETWPKVGRIKYFKKE